MTIVDRFRAQAAKHPEALAFQFLADDGTVAASLTRGELDARARAVAAELVARGLRGERVLLLYPPGLDFVVALFGCFYAGAVAVPAYPPGGLGLARTLPRLQAIAADCRPALVLTTTELSKVEPQVADLAPDLARVPWASSDEWTMRDEAGTTTPAPRASDLALIQYTSGSTATPKGVLIGHDTLSANLRQLEMRGNQGDGMRVVSWLPAYHDMGLICGILWAAFGGGRATLMSPTSFLRRPASWLRAIHRHQAWMSPAPPFALDLCVRKVTPTELVGLDFSAWKVALLGAEPIQRATLDRFAALLAPFGFQPNALCPAYGLAEAVVGVTAASPDVPYTWGRFEAAALQEGRVVRMAESAENAPSGRVLVGCGTALSENHLEIVDPATRLPAEPGRVGEIWVAGANVARGYFRREAESSEVFAARIADVPKTAANFPFLRTGDLGFVLEGQLYVAGRMKDLIILRGQNHHPQDIEHTVENAHKLVCAGGSAAFSIFSDTDGEGERLAVAAEVDVRSLPRKGPETADARRAMLAEISASIRVEVTRQHALRVHTLVLLAPGQLPKTSSGKVMRHGCRDDLAAGRLTELDRTVALGEGDLEVEALMATPETAAAGHAVDVPVVDRSATGFAAWLTPWIARRLRIPADTLTPTTPFAQLGVDSLEAVGLAADLATAVGQELPATVFLECSNVAELAEHLSSHRTVRSSCVVSLAVGGNGRPLILVPGIFGMLSAFSQLVTELSGLMPLWGLDLPLHHGLATPPSVGALAAHYVEDLLAMPGASSAEPFRFAGYCSGGMIAIEVARQLEERGRSVERVLLLDAPYLDGGAFDLETLLAKGAFLGKSFTAASPEDALRKVVRYAVEKDWTSGQGQDFIDRMVAGGVANLTTFQHWVPRPVSIATSMFSAAERVAFPLYEKDASVTAARWNEFLGRPPAHAVIPGHHHSMLQPPHVAELARLLVRELARPNDVR